MENKYSLGIKVKSNPGKGIGYDFDLAVSVVKLILQQWLIKMIFMIMSIQI